MSFADRLDEAVRAVGNPCVVGLDPHPERVPPEFGAITDDEATRSQRAEALEAFCLAVIEVVAGEVPAVKPQSAFFELFGADGARAWEGVVRAARAAGLIVIGDVKRGDVPGSAAAYARALLGGGGTPADELCDAITVNALFGSDAMEPFLAAAETHDKGLFVLVRTSNPSSAEFQGSLPDAPGALSLSERLADAVDRWGERLIGRSGLSSVGAVVGATHPEELSSLRARMPRAPILMPGLGAQGGRATDVARGFLEDGRGGLVSASRSILFAWEAEPGRAWRDLTREATRATVAAVKDALRARSRP